MERRLTLYELEIMDVVWKLGKATVQQVCDGLSRPLAYTTVMTTLRLLESKKDVLKRTKRGRAYEYCPVVSREEMSTTVFDDLRDVLFGKTVPSLVLNLLSDGSLSDSDIESLKAALDRVERET